MDRGVGIGIPAEGRGSGTMEERGGFVLVHEGGHWVGTMKGGRDLGTWRRAGEEYHRRGQGLGTTEEDKGVEDHSVLQELSEATQRGEDAETLPPAAGAHANCSL